MGYYCRYENEKVGYKGEVNLYLHATINNY